MSHSEGDAYLPLIGNTIRWNNALAPRSIPSYSPSFRVPIFLEIKSFDWERLTLFFQHFFLSRTQKKKKIKKICSFLIILLLFYYLFFPPCSYSYVGLASCFDCTQLLNCILESSSSRFIIIIIFFFWSFSRWKFAMRAYACTPDCVFVWRCVVRALECVPIVFQDSIFDFQCYD